MRPLALSLFLAASTLPLHADIFNLSGTLNGGFGDTISGTETIDTTIGLITAVDINFLIQGTTYNLTLADLLYGPPAPFTSCPLYACNYYGQEFRTPDILAKLDFEIDSPTGLIGYKGSGLCGDLGSCSYSYMGDTDDDYVQTADVLDFPSGQLTLASTTPVSNTPEPSSLLLLGTGALGLLGTARYRKLNEHF